MREHVHDFEAIVASCIVLGLEEILRAQSDAETEAFNHHLTVAKRTVILEPEEENVEDIEIVTLEGIQMASWNKEQLVVWIEQVLKSCERYESPDVHVVL